VRDGRKKNRLRAQANDCKEITRRLGAIGTAGHLGGSLVDLGGLGTAVRDTALAKAPRIFGGGRCDAGGATVCSTICSAALYRKLCPRPRLGGCEECSQRRRSKFACDDGLRTKLLINNVLGQREKGMGACSY
jgi:hypothetical protein